MSTQTHSRPRRNASPRAGPQPIRATLPFTLRQGSPPTRNTNGRRSSPGPASSPTQPWPTSGDSHNKTKHRSSDHRTSPERSPSSPGFKVEKPKAVRASPAPPIRRTSSLDTIAGPYLTGHWPRAEPYTSYNGLYGPNQKHQWTQTEDVERKCSHKRSSSLGSADNLKEKYKQQLRKQGSRQTSSASQRASPVHGNHATVANLPSPVNTSTTSSSTSTSTSNSSSSTASSQTSTPPLTSSSSSSSTSSSSTTSSSTSTSSFQQVSVSTSLIGQAHTLPRSTAIPVPNTLRAPPVPRIRGSVEGLNQEVEKLVLIGKEEDDERPAVETVRDGHRAPVPGVANMQTQTPAETNADPSEGSNSNPGSRNHSVSPTFVMDNSRPSSRSSSTGNGEAKIEKGEGSPEYHFTAKYSSSPSHNKSWQLTRDPPDGCERPTNTRDEMSLLEEYSTLAYCPDSKLPFKLKQSDSSAFCAILPNFPPVPGEFTLKVTAQTQTTPTPLQKAQTGFAETNGHAE